MIRYRLPAGSTPPLTDVIGHLLEGAPLLRVRTKRGEVVDIAANDVVVIKTLSDAPVRTSEIRNLEYAAAMAWPGAEQRWVDGWLLRYGHGSTRRANSAVPLDVSATADVSRIVEWYATRGVPPLIAAPDRLFRLSPQTPVDAENIVMTCDLASIHAQPVVALRSRPDEQWLGIYQRDVPLDVLTAVVDGEVAFATVAGAAVGRAAMTMAPDGTRWVGLAAVRVDEEARRHGHARTLCAALLAWGAEQGATRAYVQVLIDNNAATTLFESMDFTAHHRSRYVRADAL